MTLAGVKNLSISVLALATAVGCSGGGGSGVPSQTIATASPSPSPTPSTAGSPGPIIASWKGDGSYTARSNPNWPLSFVPLPGNASVMYTNGPPIVYTALGQSVTVLLSQANYSGLLPILATFTGQCSGLFGNATGSSTFQVKYSGIGSTNCVLQFDGAYNGPNVGVSVILPITVPSGG